MERALTLRWRAFSDWRARFFADLILAKVKLQKRGAEKGAELCRRERPRVKRWRAMKAPSLLRSMLTFSGGTFVSRILGLVREMAIAWAFGANATTDAFWVAFRIPNFMRRLFAEGSFSVAFVPVLTEFKETRSHAELKELVSRTAGTLGLILLVVTALGVLGAAWVTRGFAPGLDRRAAQVRPDHRPAAHDVSVPAVRFADRAGRRNPQQFQQVRASRADPGHPQPLHDRRRAVAGAAARGADHGAGLGDPRRRHPAAC